jgi:hypothetical protein
MKNPAYTQMDRAPRALQAPNRFAQASSDAARKS